MCIHYLFHTDPKVNFLWWKKGNYQIKCVLETLESRILAAFGGVARSECR